MVTDLRSFIGSMVHSIVDQKGEFIFDLFEYDEIVTAAMDKAIPTIPANNWAVGGRTK